MKLSANPSLTVFEQNKDLSDMSLDELQVFSEQIGEDIFSVLTLEGSVSARNHIGGTAPQQVRAAATRAQTRINRALIAAFPQTAKNYSFLPSAGGKPPHSSYTLRVCAVPTPSIPQLTKASTVKA